MDWANIFVPTVPVGESILRGTLIYLGIVIFMRSFGQREAGSLSLPDLIVALLISEAVSNGLGSDDNSITNGLIVAVTILFWSTVLDALAYKFKPIRHILQTTKRPLIHDGELNLRLMRRELLTKDEIETQLRLQGIKSVDDVARAYLEANGQISAFRKDDA